jgi:hypothetical protein
MTLPIVPHHFEHADDFFAQLAPSHPDWRSERWAFRGQGNADWSLVPSVLRTGKDGKPPWLVPDIESHIRMASAMASTPEADAHLFAMRRLRGEPALVMRFRDLADRVGLSIPEDSARLRSWRNLERIIGGSPFAQFGAGMSGTPQKRWPQAELLSQVALAQHYGVKTRLLDWTRKPRVAAYFAARDVMRGVASREIAVWALRAEILDYLWADQVDDPDVELVHAPQAPNPNLSAQAGLFTVARHVHEDVGFESVLFQKTDGRGPPVGTFLRKLTLPASEARGLMARLYFEGVFAATVFPGYAGVAETFAESDWWSGAS